MADSSRTLASWVVLGSIALCPFSAYAIRHGVPTAVGAFPAVGMLEPACTATLITPDTVITANHCVKQAGATAYLKFHYVDAKGKEVILSAIPTIQPAILASLPSQELALIRLNGSVKGVSFPTLSTAEMTATLKIGTIVGFGATEALPVSQKLLQGSVKYSLKAVTLTSPAGQSFPNIPMWKTVPADAKTDNLACTGDSGGPLFDDKGQLLGVVSGYYEGDANFAALGVSAQCAKAPWVYYVPIQPYLKWIKESLVKLGSAKK
jgi:hypothetical protein